MSFFSLTLYSLEMPFRIIKNSQCKQSKSQRSGNNYQSEARQPFSGKNFVTSLDCLVGGLRTKSTASCVCVCVVTVHAGECTTPNRRKPI